MIRIFGQQTVAQPSQNRSQGFLNRVFWGVGLLLLGLFLTVMPGGQAAHADPVYEGRLFYGLDPVITATDNPHLLGVDRLVMRERLLSVGVDPVKDLGKKPELIDSFRKIWWEKISTDIERKEILVEFDRSLGLVKTFEYPKWFYLFPAAQTLPGGIVYYPPRPTTDSLVRLQIDDLERARERSREVDRILARDKLFGGDKVGTLRNDDGLLNLTIPIKLPRTLEKIIGKGEKTRIKITGREFLALRGESTVVSPFTPSERVSSQSLFPSLEMEQELQVNLSGTIGEKIIIEVDHNSAVMGPDATKIKLMYQGEEDEVIHTIETGDVGLTLPGSQLLGYSSSKSGLFGIKVTGQVGRAAFTGVVSKQKAESSAKTFNSKGGEVEDHVIRSSDYINHRFFRLDLPPLEGDYGYFPQRVKDSPGRNLNAGYSIDPTSIKIYRMMGIGTFGTNDVRNVAIYEDSTGVFWQASQGSPIVQDWSDPQKVATRWREIAFDVMTDVDGGLVAVDTRSQMANEDYLAVTYNVVDQNGNIIYRVGDKPGEDDPVEIPGQGESYYRMKMLKAPVNLKLDRPFWYVLRNIYPLGGANIDIDSFDLKIERETSESFPDIDENEVPYIEIFGLDSRDPQGSPGADGVVDMTDATLFDLRKGLLKFPLYFPAPFAPGSIGMPANGQFTNNYSEDDFLTHALATYQAGGNAPGMAWDGSFLQENQPFQLYSPSTLPSDYSTYSRFRLVARHAATASSFNLGVSNIEEGSEVVTLDGRTLVNGTDYEIDYLFGQISLKGENANLSPDSQLSVTYQYTPFFGGGQTNLLGLNMDYDLGRESTLSTTWLYQSESIVGEKAKLGEEPSKTVVGNLILGHTFKPYFLTHVANFLSLRNSERESSLQFNAEAAVSLPNPNTKNQAYLEDFEGVDASDIITLTRIGWSWAAAPQVADGQQSQDTRTFDPEDRVENVRWFTPQNRVERRMLNPDLVNQERTETQQVMDLYLRDDEGWNDESWGGISRGLSRTGLDLSKSQFIEIWINDGVPDLAERSGKVHLDFGYINEDGFWPLDEDGDLIVGTHEQEDGIAGSLPDGVWSYEEDIGLDGDENGRQFYEAAYEINGDSPYPKINGTSRNGREDNEDINGNSTLDTDDGYFRATIDLKETEALVDVVEDYDNVSDLVAAGQAWRKYRIRIGDVDVVSTNLEPNIQAVTHVRIWYENDERDGSTEPVHLQLSELKFLGSRWERQGVRLSAGEVLLSENERLAGEEFFLGEVNNKENPDYTSPFSVREVENIPEKEQSLVMEYRNLDAGHMVRANKQVSLRGDDYTTYRDMSWYIYNPLQGQADMDVFFRVGSDTLNYYEVGYRFSESTDQIGWKKLTVNLAELSNVKSGTVDNEGIITGEVEDEESGHIYPVRVVGLPDLRNVRNYYWVIANNAAGQDVSGYFYLNDVRLEGVKTDMGLAQSAGVRLNMADVLTVDADWSKTDAEYHGLDRRVGSGTTSENWSLSTSFNLDDFIPLGGFKVPVSGSRQQTIARPKYETNSDVEILDEDKRNALSEISTTERFSASLRKSPSKGAILRYLIDPWMVQSTGSRTLKHGPLNDSDQKNLSGSLAYDLRIPGHYHLGDYPILEHIPLVKGFNVVPRKIALSASFQSSYSSRRNINADGSITQQPVTKNRPGTLTASFDYDPMDIINLSLGGTSQRDLLREYRMYEVNIGEENLRKYDVRMTIVPPQPKVIPQGFYFYPVKQVVKGMKKIKPSIQFTGNFQDDHNPLVAQDGDPSGTRNISNGNRWDIRFSLPMGDFFETIMPEKKYDEAQRRKMIEEQQRINEHRSRRPGEETVPRYPKEWDNLPPDEKARKLEEFYLEQAELRMEEERNKGFRKEEVENLDGGPGFGLGTIYNLASHPLRELKPLKVTFSKDRNSTYGRIYSSAGFWYKAGFRTHLDVPDTTFISATSSETGNLSLSTSTQIVRSMNLDMKYSQKETDRLQVGSNTRSYLQNWPDASVSLSGLEKWRIFGGGGESLDSGWFRSSNINVSYKRSKTVNNITSTSYNPSYSSTVTPRWSFTFHNGLSATLNATLGNDHAVNNGVITDNRKMRFGLQLRHQFKAQGLLARMGLYRPGSNPAIDMNVDVGYSRDRSERINPGSPAAAPTGKTRFNIDPRFSYQVNRNLSGALTMTFGRSKDVATGSTTTNLGLGVEATFVF